jgi:serine/threonine-protein kinase ATR
LAGTYKLELPPPDFTIEAPIWKDIPAFDPRTIRFQLTDIEHAALVGVQIFAALSRIACAPQVAPGIRSAADSFTSVLQGLAKTWSALNIWETLPVVREKTPVVYSAILNAVAAALDRSAQGKFDGLYLFAVRCVADTLMRPVDQITPQTEHMVSGIILSLMMISRESSLVQELLNDRLLSPAFAMFSNENLWNMLRPDTQVVILRLIIATTDSNNVIEKARALLHANTGGEWICKDSGLDKKLKAIPSVEVDNGNGPRKRPRLDGAAVQEDLVKSLASKVYSLFGNQEASDVDGLSQVAPEGFSRLSEEDRCTAVHTLGLLSCAVSGDLVKIRAGTENIYKCSYCDSEAPIFRRTRHFANSSDVELLKTLEAIHTLEHFTESPKIRAWGADSLRRMTNHTQELTHLDLESSKLGQWCISLLRSKRRELRIAAG